MDEIFSKKISMMDWNDGDDDDAIRWAIFNKNNDVCKENNNNKKKKKKLN